MAKADKYIFIKDRIRSILGGSLIRFALHQCFKLEFTTADFAENPYGKPFLKGRDNIHFSLSYTEGWMGCAVSTDPVGYDIEKEKEIDLSIAQRYFTKDEYRRIKKCGDEDKQSFFFRLWVLKESYIKAIGKGLSCPLNSFYITAEKERIEIKTESADLPKMDFSMIQVAENYHSGVCCSPGIKPDGPVHVLTSDLIQSGI